jgi:hypothetical protein
MASAVLTEVVARQPRAVEAFPKDVDDTYMRALTYESAHRARSKAMFAAGLSGGNSPDTE